MSCCVPRPAAIRFASVFFFFRDFGIYLRIHHGRVASPPRLEAHIWGFPLLPSLEAKTSVSHDFVLYCRSLGVKARQVKPVRQNNFL